MEKGEVRGEKTFKTLRGPERGRKGGKQLPTIVDQNQKKRAHGTEPK